jgi:hypothetical protein
MGKEKKLRTGRIILKMKYSDEGGVSLRPNLDENKLSFSFS